LYEGNPPGFPPPSLPAPRIPIEFERTKKETP
jgi:hypothetical protein